MLTLFQSNTRCGEWTYIILPLIFLPAPALVSQFCANVCVQSEWFGVESGDECWCFLKEEFLSHIKDVERSTRKVDGRDPQTCPQDKWRTARAISPNGAVAIGGSMCTNNSIEKSTLATCSAHEVSPPTRTREDILSDLRIAAARTLKSLKQRRR